MRLRVDLCTGFVKVGELEAGTFSATVRNIAIGDFTATCPVAAVSVAPELVDTLVVVDEDFSPARIVFAGLVRRPDGSDSSTTREVNPAGSLVTWRGIDLWGLLATRRVFPEPLSTPPWTTSSHDTRTGVASTVAAGLISDHIGATALADRSITSLAVVDPEIGVTGEWSFRLTLLSEAVAQICREAGIGCVAEMPTYGVPRFRLRSYDDHSARVILSDQGDLETLTKVSLPASASYVVGAGSGELTSRLFAASSSGATGIDRVESLYDATNITTTAALLRATEAQLQLGVEDVKVEGSLDDRAAQSLIWGTDYELGDLLGVEVDGVRRSAQVEQVRIELTPIRQIVRPILGRTTTSAVQKLLRDTSDLAARFDRNVQ